MEWIGTLPKGREGTIAFLNGLTSTYVKAFALSIIVYDPLHYTVHWFDDTSTDVKMYSYIEDTRVSAFYFAVQLMRDKYRCNVGRPGSCLFLYAAKCGTLRPGTRH